MDTGWRDFPTKSPSYAKAFAMQALAQRVAGQEDSGKIGFRYDSN